MKLQLNNIQNNGILNEVILCYLIVIIGIFDLQNVYQVSKLN